MDKTQYLVRTADGRDYCRVEPWEGGLPAAREGARRIGGFVVELDTYLLPTDSIVDDFRTP
ncbi:MAG: hypothetical protein WAX14_03150 [Rhodococcus sp. (in: high G+C Gram-positive bacteria)]|uniref:hypothetical protein n=1 Tax=Rhodococcus sp. TaxID=1831 RepID=UPI003BB6E45E